MRTIERFGRFKRDYKREKKGQLTLLDSDDFREGTRAFQQRRPAKFTDR